MFYSCLSERSQLDSIYGHNSTKKNILHGVPQGSVHIPPLFIISNNDLPTVSNEIKICLFADDTNVYLESETFSAFVQNLYKQLKLIKTRIDANLLPVCIQYLQLTTSFFIPFSCLFLPILLAKLTENISINRIT